HTTPDPQSGEQAVATASHASTRAVGRCRKQRGNEASRSNQRAVVSASPSLLRPCAVPGENAVMKDPCHCPASPQGRIHPPSRDLSGGTADTKECNAIEKRRKGREYNLDRAMDLLKELLHPLAEPAIGGLNGIVYSGPTREARLFFPRRENP